MHVLRMARAHSLMKDLADTPALSLGPEELQSAAVQLAEELQADNISVIAGVDQLIAQNYPQIAAVGMGAEERRAPRIINIRWDGPKKGKSEAANASSLPLVTIIGKGITFDTGGLNIKSGGGMRTMKRDMAGAAQVPRHQLPLLLITIVL
jgi:leucyl aminopeptidase